MAGPNFGLDLVVNIEQSKYMAKVTESAGARVVVQSASAHPQPDEVGNQLIPNTNTALAMHEVPDLIVSMVQHTCYYKVSFSNTADCYPLSRSLYIKLH